MKNLILLACFISFLASAQETREHNLSANGYLTNMQSFTFQEFDGDWLSDNLIHNRLNFKWHNRQDNLNAVLEMRNRFISGESVESIPGYDDLVNSESGYLNLSWNLSTGKSYILNSKIDRLYLDYTLDKLQIRIGRQRINWGQCFTWNPNDIFNTYSFFDFDYIEKPGCDAVRLQYYTSSTSSAEISAKVDSSEKVTAAAIWRFNKWNYDMQLMGGIYNQQDYVVGAGWSGNIVNASFRGEISYFHPKDNFSDTTGTIVLSLGSEYTFSNSLMLQGEILYNQLKNTGQQNFLDFYYVDLNAKQLSFAEFSAMAQASYPITPLFNVSLAGMYFPKIKGYFVGPTLSYSLTDNIDFSLIAQSFSGEFTDGQRDDFYMLFMRLKWNF